MIHELKIQRDYFEKVVGLEKRFEVRKKDRDFRTGDLIALNEIDEAGTYTGRSALMQITYILDNAEYCKGGTVIMTIEPCQIRVDIQQDFTGGNARTQIIERKKFWQRGMDIRG